MINWIKAYVPTSVGEEAFCGKDRQVSPGKVKSVLGGETAPRWSLPAQGRCPSHGRGHKPPGEGVRTGFEVDLPSRGVCSSPISPNCGF